MYIKVELDPLGGTAYQNMGTTQLLSVPYSLYSETSGEGGLTLPYSGIISNIDYAFSITNTLSSGICSKTTASSGNGIALYGETASSIGLGVNALATSTTGQCYGVRGQSNSSSGLGVVGHAASTTGITYGVKGQSMSSTGYGVHGVAFSSTGINYGVYGVSLSTEGYGVYGVGVNGVFGEANLDDGIGVHGIHNFTSGAGYGVLGESSSPIGTAVKGSAISSSGTNYGIYGTTASPNGYGVFASAPVTGIYGQGTNESGESYGVIGDVASTNGIGVFGRASDYDGTNKGVYGLTLSTNGIGVHGYAALSNSTSAGVLGETNAQSGKGIYGKAISSSGTNYGVYGEVTSSSGYSGYFIGGKFYAEKNVGIGTTEPDCQLSVRAPLTGSMDLANLKNTSNNYLFRLRQSANGSGGFYIYDGSNTNTIFFYGEGNSFINGGNLGIGTTTPAYKLDIAGVTNLNKGIASGVAMRVNSDEALWYNGTYFSWGYGGTYNFVGNKLKIAGNGNTAPSYELQVDGNAAKSLGGSTWIVSSDLRLKNLNGNYTKGLDEIIALQPVSFSYKAGNSRGLPSEVEQVGFVAQEVQKVFPEAVNEGEDGLLDFNMHPVNVALVNAIKELKAENDRLKDENEKTNARLDKIESSMSLSAAK